MDRFQSFAIDELLMYVYGLNGLRPMLSVSEKLARYGSTLLSQMGYLSRGVN
jgi:hypothetical protein